MKSKILAIMLMFSVVAAYAADDPHEVFDTKDNYTTQSTITWLTVNNVQKTCEAESRKRGYNGFGFGVQACSFYDGNTCTIITGKKTTMHSVGHEVRHCFQANWHQ